MANDQAAYNYLLGKGLTDYQAAGVVGNLLQESNCNPLSHTSVSDGVGQWEHPRWSALTAWASSQGKDPRALQTQLDYLWRELTTIPMLGLAQLKATTNLPDAVRAFQNLFERCSVCNEPRRISLAQGVLAKYATAATTAPASNDAAQFFFKIVVPLGVAAGLAYYLKDHIGFDRKRARA